MDKKILSKLFEMSPEEKLPYVEELARERQAENPAKSQADLALEERKDMAELRKKVLDALAELNVALSLYIDKDRTNFIIHKMRRILQGESLFDSICALSAMMHAGTNELLKAVDRLLEEHLDPNRKSGPIRWN